MNKKFYLIAFFTLWFIAQTSFICLDGIYSKAQKSEYGIVFGNKVNPNGQLSDRLKARVDEAYRLYKDSTIQKIVVSGGFGKEGHWEGQKMAHYLVSKGVPKNKIYIDDYGDNSWLTATNFTKKFPNNSSLVVISQYHHLTRCKLAFRKNGFTKVTASSPAYYEFSDLFSIFREFFAFYKYLIVY